MDPLRLGCASSGLCRRSSKPLEINKVTHIMWMRITTTMTTTTMMMTTKSMTPTTKKKEKVFFIVLKRKIL